MNRVFLLLIFLVILDNAVFSQQKEDYRIGEILSFKSAILDETASLQLYLPEGHRKDGPKKYPVVFVFDGNNYFHTVSGVVRQLALAKKIPETIVVGVNPDRKYCFDKAMLSKYLDFMAGELQAFLLDNYNAIPYNVLIANSVYGQIGLYALIEKSDIFQSFLLSSSFFTFSDYLYDFEYFLNTQKMLQNDFFISAGFEEEGKIDKVYKLARVLSWTPIEGLTWHYKQYEQADREMVLLLSVIDCLPQIFSDIQIPAFASYSDFMEKFDNQSRLLDKYQYDFMDLSSSPMSISQAFLKLVLNGEELTECAVKHLKESPCYFSDNVELYNLSSYLASIGKTVEAQKVHKLIEGKLNKEFANNYTDVVDLNRGLIIDLPLDSGNISDIIANGGEVQFAETTLGIDGLENSAVLFTYKDGRISLNNQFTMDPRKSISVSCWIHPHQLRPADSWAISMKEGNKGPHWNTTVGVYPDQWGLEIYSLSRFLYFVRDTIPLNQWTNIVFVADQSIGRLSIYKNGEIIYESDELVPFFNSSETVQIGNDLFAFDGKLDEFRLYQRALSEKEAKQLYIERRKLENVNNTH